MGIDLSQFHQVFFEESIEGLDAMETALMELDPANVDGETINAVFREFAYLKKMKIISMAVRVKRGMT